MAKNYGTATEAKIEEVIDTCTRYGARSIIALSGAPATGKSFIASIAAQRIASEPIMVREVQFHPSYSYEEFIEGYRANAAGGFTVEKGTLLEWNDQALDDPANTYVILIEEFTRANVPAVIGELLTYLEHRDRAFVAPYSRRPVKIAKNLKFLATYNPRDRSALELDTAIIRRLRIMRFGPDTKQLAEMLGPVELPETVVSKMQAIFTRAAQEFGDDYESLVPFGHGIFAEVVAETPDLHLLWKQRIEHLLRPPGRQPDPFAEIIAKNYPWKDGAEVSVEAAAAPAKAAEATGEEADAEQVVTDEVAEGQTADALPQESADAP